jgi:hypothetical protein
VFGSPPDAGDQSFRSRYRFKVIQWSLHDEFGWYWILEFDEERVNGGICKHWLDGKEWATSYMYRDEDKRFHRAYFWDSETHMWVSKGALEHT